MTDPLIDQLSENSLCLLQRLQAENALWRCYPSDHWPAPVPLNSDRITDTAWLWFKLGDDAFAHRGYILFRLPRDGGPPVPVNQSTILTSSKEDTKARLNALGFATPEGRRFHRDRLVEALDYAADMPGLVCVKPDLGSLGDLVFPGLRTAVEIAEAIAAVASDYEEIVIERSVPGEVYRFFYVEPEIVGVKLSRLAAVTGNGQDSIATLMAAENARRAARPMPGLCPIPDGHGLDFMLRHQGLTPDSVPAAGRRVLLNPISNTQFGSESFCGPHLTHPGYAELMRGAFAAIPDLRIAAIDAILSQPQAPPAPGNVHILEINSNPGFVTFHHPTAGPTVDIAGHLLDYLRRTTPAERSAP